MSVVAQAHDSVINDNHIGHLSSLPYEDVLLNIPYHTLENSEIVPEFVDFLALWEQMPSLVQLRKPTKVFSAVHDGFNINTMYRKCDQFVKKHPIGVKSYSALSQYFSSLLLIKTKMGEVLGAFITAFPTMGVQGRFLGGPDSFVFYFDEAKRGNQEQAGTSDIAASIIRPTRPFHHYSGTYKNNYYLFCEHDTITIGSEGEGPAIRISDV